MGYLQEKLAEILPGQRDAVNDLIGKHGDKVISAVTVKQAFGGMRGVKSLICDTSCVEPDRGLIIRGKPILDLVECSPEEIFHLLLTGELPDEASLADLRKDLQCHREVPAYVWNVLDAMAGDAHPMVMLSSAVLVMHRDSVFAREYRKGMHKTDYWIYVLEDALRLMARIPAITAYIYRRHFGKGPRIDSDPEKDWAADLAHMLGVGNPGNAFADLMRLYMVLHIDHEGGNVSTHACRCVGSALSDPFYAVSAGLNGLSGPLHGLANQECLRFVLSVREQFGGVPTEKQIVDFAWETLNSGKVIPGYGHAVLRITDPRFIAFRNFGLQFCSGDEIFKIVDLLYHTIPDILKKHGRAKNPWPNVDAGSGALLYHFGIQEFDYYTVLFGASRILGMLAQLILSRGLMEPIERPKSVSMEWVKQTVGAS